MGSRIQKLGGKHVFALAALATAFSCQTTAPLPGPLPFHAALAPVEALNNELSIPKAREASYARAREASYAEPREASHGPGEGDESDDAKEVLTLHLDPSRVTKGLEDALRKGFARVTVLDPPREADFAGRSEDERAGYWREKSLEAGADLWVQPSVSYEPRIEHRANEKFWLNLPLFLIGGPFCYFVADNTYNARVKLNADFIDVTSPHDDPLSGNVLPVPIQVDFKGTDLTFVERADDAGDYLLSIIVPAGFLSRESPDVVEEVRDKIIDEIADLFVREVLENDRFFSRADRLAAVELAHARAVVRRDGQEVVLELPVRANRFVIRAGDARISDLVSREEDADGYHWIRRRIVVSRDTSHIQLRLEDARSEGRRYTLRIPEASAE